MQCDLTYIILLYRDNKFTSQQQIIELIRILMNVLKVLINKQKEENNFV
jgi:hypothetical protein